MEALGAFRGAYSAAWLAGMRAKLGLPDTVDDETVGTVAAELLALVQAGSVDHTTLFRGLGRAARGDAEPVRGLVLDLAGIDAWLDRWRALGPDGDRADRANPVYIPRNHLVEQALDAAVDGDLSTLERLLEAVRAPFDERPGLERYAEPAPEHFGRYRTFCGT